MTGQLEDRKAEERQDSWGDWTARQDNTARKDHKTGGGKIRARQHSGTGQSGRTRRPGKDRVPGSTRGQDIKDGEG